MRSPNPVFTNPLAKKKEMTINHMTSLVKAPNAAPNVRVLVTTAIVNPRKAHAPTGRGDSTSPVMVDKKIASSCHACVVTATGLATRYLSARPTPTDTTKGKGFTPSHTAAGFPLFPLSSPPIAAASLTLITALAMLPLETQGESWFLKLLRLLLVRLTRDGRKTEEEELEPKTQQELEKAQSVLNCGHACCFWLLASVRSVGRWCWREIQGWVCVRREEEEDPPCIMSRDATSTAGAMAPLLVAALNPSNNTAIWSHGNDEEWSERGRESDERQRSDETGFWATVVEPPRLSLACAEKQHFIYLFIIFSFSFPNSANRFHSSCPKNLGEIWKRAATLSKGFWRQIFNTFARREN